ncbi:MAG TPA: elongation factor EF-2, partial [Euryarchaeota archaeon]|nr:elongation factor EF-2 [Euryarchaeota archaeon]
EQMQEKFMKIIAEVDRLIKKNCPPEYRKEWSLNVEGGSVAFGSAYHNWAISVPFMKKTGISFKDIFDFCAQGEQKTLAKKSPIHQVLLDMTIEHLPNPLEAQKRRIPKIWRGEDDSPVGKAMINCDPKGDVTFMVTKIIMDPHAGEVAVGRLFSGSVKRGQELYVIGMPNKQRAQLVSLSVGPDRIPVESMGAGNIANVSGLRDAIAGSTVSNSPDLQPFERILHYSEPVVTVAIEAKSTKDLPKLVEVLRSIAKADPSIVVDINQETGESLMSGMGELHLEITQYRIEKEHGVPIKASPPIVVYRECVDKLGGPFEGKSPNKHNRFYLTVEPLEEKVLKAILTGDITSELRIKKNKETDAILQEGGWSKEEIKGLKAVHNGCVLIDSTKGIQYLHETMELIVQSFAEAMNGSPLAREKAMGIKVKLHDAKLHEDNIHRGPAQVIPAVRSSIFGAMCVAGRILLEPMQKVFIQVPDDHMGSATSELQTRRGTILDMGSEGDQATIDAVAPVAEMFGFAGAIRGATSGRAIWSTENSGYQKVPRELQDNIVKQIRTRKGLNPEPQDANYYAA